MIIPLLAGDFKSFLPYTVKRRSRGTAVFIMYCCIGHLLFLTLMVTFFVIPQRFYDVRSMGRFLEECRDEITPDTLIISRGTDFHAVCYFFKRNDVYLLSPGELTYGMAYPEDKPRELLYSTGGRTEDDPRVGVRQFLKENPGRKVVMFFPASHFYRIRQQSGSFPDPVLVKKSIESDPETKKADGFVMVRFQ